MDRCGRPGYSPPREHATAPGNRASTMIRLSIQPDQGQARVVTVESDTVTIGRNPQNELSLPTKGVSGAHCRIRKTSHGYSIADLNSTNGTYVNRRRISVNQAISPADEIVVATYTLRVVDPAAARPAAASSASPQPPLRPGQIAAPRGAGGPPRPAGTRAVGPSVARRGSSSPGAHPPAPTINPSGAPKAAPLPGLSVPPPLLTSGVGGRDLSETWPTL
ncbi:MAG: FHA domain-containing protein, partial [Myxococcales bacterium FL481]